jgi:hypothetical protein
VDVYRRQCRVIPWEHVSRTWNLFAKDDLIEEAAIAAMMNKLRILVDQLGSDEQHLLHLRFAAGLRARDIGFATG